MIIGWTIFISVLVCFAIAAIFFVKRFDKLQLPKGTALFGKYKDYKIHVVLSAKTQPLSKSKQDQLVDACAKASWAIDTVWALPRKSSVLEAVVYFKAEEDYADIGHWQAWARCTVSYITWCHKMFGKSVPMAVIREKHIEEVISKGEPLIHEWCHALNGEYVARPSDHTQPKIWAALGSTSSQYQARVLFASNR